MVKFNRKVEYALMILGYMSSKKGSLVTNRDVCEQVGVPSEISAKILQVLGQKNILTSRQGVKGGYSLSRDLSDLTLYQLQSFFLGDRYIVDCLFEDRQCDQVDRCKMMSQMKKLNHRIDEVFRDINIKEFLEV